MAASTSRPGAENHPRRTSRPRERILGSAKKAGRAYIDAYEGSLKTMADLHETVGRASGVGLVAAVTSVQANLARSMAEAYASALRETLR